MTAGQTASPWQTAHLGGPFAFMHSAALEQAAAPSNRKSIHTPVTNMFLDYVPAKLAAGTSLQLRRNIVPYKASDGWQYRLALRIPGATAFAGQAVGDAFELTIPATATAAWPTGTYTFSERLVSADGAIVHEVGSGTVTITPALELAEGQDGLTHSQRSLAIIEAALEGRLGDGIHNYSIGGRAVAKITLPELIKLRDYYRLQVALERRKGISFGTVQFTFGGSQ